MDLNWGDDINNIESVNFRNSSKSISGFEMLTLKEMFRYKGTESIMKPYKINFYMIIFIVEGSGSHEIDFISHTVNKFDLIFVSKNRVHCFKDIRDLDGMVMLFSEDFLLSSFGENYDSGLEIFHQTKLHPYITSNNTVMHSQINTIRELYNARAGSLLLKLSIHSLLVMTKEFYLTNINDGKSLIMTKFKILLDEYLMSNRSVEFYAKKLNMSSKTLNRLLKKESDITVKTYIQEQLLYEMKYRLCFKDKSIQEISYDMGFSEPSYMTKFFKTHTGLSPSEFMMMNK